MCAHRGVVISFSLLESQHTPRPWRQFVIVRWQIWEQTKTCESAWGCRCRSVGSDERIWIRGKRGVVSLRIYTCCIQQIGMPVYADWLAWGKPKACVCTNFLESIVPSHAVCEHEANKICTSKSSKAPVHMQVIGKIYNWRNGCAHMGELVYGYVPANAYVPVFLSENMAKNLAVGRTRLSCCAICLAMFRKRPMVIFPCKYRRFVCAKEMRCAIWHVCYAFEGFRIKPLTDEAEHT